MLNKLITKIFGQTSFVKNTLVLMSGTTMAQLLALVITPVLTRIFSPDEFGRYALFLNITAILAVLITFRYELAVMLPKTNNEARIIVKLSVVVSFLLSLLFFLIIVFFKNTISKVLTLQLIGNWLYGLPVVLFFIGIYQTFNCYQNRQHQYKKMSNAIMLQSGSSSTLNIGTGLLQMGSAGLLSSYIVSQTISAIYIAKNEIVKIFNDKSITLKQLKTQAVLHRNFPLFDMPNALFYNFSTKGVILVLVKFFGETIVGFYSLTERVLITPFSFFTNAFSQAYYEKIARLSEINLKTIGVDVNKTIDKLITILIIPFSLIIAVSKPLVPIFLGAKWALIYPYIYVLAPVILLNLILSPQSHIFKVINKQQFALIINLTSFIIRISTLIIASIFVSNPIFVFLIFSIVSSVVLIANAWYINRLVGSCLSVKFITLISLFVVYYIIISFILL